MKEKFVTFILLLSVIWFHTSCSKKKGCTNPASINYDPEAEENDGSCVFSGCTDLFSISYNPIATIDDGSCQYAGSGGNTTIVGSPEYHGVPIPSHSNYLDSAFVKFNSTQIPGINASDYDTIYVGNIGEDHVHMAELKPGYYYIMMTGWDTTINQRVYGGMSIALSQTSGDLNITVPVTEQ
jgi:hypothetical protein